LAEGRGGWLVTANLDFLYRCARDPARVELYAQADLAVADGMPLIWAARLQGEPLPCRVAGSDLVWLMAERAAADDRSLYLLGGEAGAAEEARDVLLDRWPSLRIAGISSPFVAATPTPDELAEIRADLIACRPDIVYVALGSPKQELVIAAVHEQLPHTWFAGVGMSLSFIAGRSRRAPLWIQRIGLEWLHRLAQEPRRLIRRYFLENIPFVFRLLGSAWLLRFKRQTRAG
jgi:N-acetylglucosaminyldiphosphoundecaprenol N-acetyl-beta-D-mannosaminyltransferase